MDYVWKEIPDTNGRYAISIYGEVHDIEKNNFIKPHMSGVKRRNYPQVTLYIQDGIKKIKKTKRVHSLMAITFLNFVYNGKRDFVVDHIDNNPLNNNLNNLQIVSMKVNNTKDRNIIAD
jgi:hypothetical protein